MNYKKRIAARKANPEFEKLHAEARRKQAEINERIRSANMRSAGIEKPSGQSPVAYPDAKALAAEVAVEPNRVELFGEITGESAIEFKRRLARCDKSKPLTIVIDSQGGQVMAGMSIVDAVKAWPGRTIGRVESNALSMGSAILAACDERLVSPNATVMLHKPYTENEIDESDKKLLRNLESNLIKAYAGIVRGGAIKVIELMARGNAWLTASEAIACGLATGYIPSK